MKRYYHVLSGLRGCYMPDCNEVFTNRRDAEIAAICMANDARFDGERVKGSARAGYYEVGASNCIEVTECTEPDCLEDLC